SRRLGDNARAGPRRALSGYDALPHGRKARNRSSEKETRHSSESGAWLFACAQIRKPGDACCALRRRTIIKLWMVPDIHQSLTVAGALCTLFPGIRASIFVS